MSNSHVFKIGYWAACDDKSSNPPLTYNKISKSEWLEGYISAVIDFDIR